MALFSTHCAPCSRGHTSLCTAALQPGKLLGMLEFHGKLVIIWLYILIYESAHTLQMWLPGWITVQGGPWYPNLNAGSPLEWSLHHFPATHPPQGSFGTPLYSQLLQSKQQKFTMPFLPLVLYSLPPTSSGEVTPSSPAFQNNPLLPGNLPDVSHL